MAENRSFERRGCTPVSFVLNQHQAFDLRSLKAHGHRLSDAGDENQIVQCLDAAGSHMFVLESATAPKTELTAACKAASWR